MAAAMATSMAVANLKMISGKARCVTKATSPKSVNLRSVSPASGSGVLAGAVFSALAISDPAIAAQQLAEIAEADNRGLALLLPIIPAIAWVLFNILQPALNQINRMRNTKSKGVIVGLGLGGLGLLYHTPPASAGSLSELAEAAGGDNRGQLLLLIVAPAIAWVLFNIFQPALNQINRMRSK